MTQENTTCRGQLGVSKYKYLRRPMKEPLQCNSSCFWLPVALSCRSPLRLSRASAAPEVQLSTNHCCPLLIISRSSFYPRKYAYTGPSLFPFCFLLLLFESDFCRRPSESDRRVTNCTMKANTSYVTLIIHER